MANRLIILWNRHNQKCLLFKDFGNFFMKELQYESSGWEKRGRLEVWGVGESVSYSTSISKGK